MSLTIKKSGQSVQFTGSGGQLCGSYHYEDMFKSFFRGLYTPSGKDVVACPPPEHLHHKGLMFGLTTSAANFWEEDEFSEPNNLPIGRQRTRAVELMPQSEGIGFTQTILWETDTAGILNETRKISVTEEPGSYLWTWKTTLIASQDVQITKSVWGVPSYCSQQFGYCGLGLRLASDLFQNGEVLPAGTKCGSTPACVFFRGDGVQVKFEPKQVDALFVSTYQSGGPYPGGPGFAYLCLVPTPRDLKQGTSLECNYVISVSDV